MKQPAPQGLYKQIADLEAKLAKYKRANRRAMDLLTTALQALDAKDYHVVNEMVERASDHLYGVNRKPATCGCGDPACWCGCVPGNYPCEHGSLGAGCGQ
jgi:hypothetical protein